MQVAQTILQQLGGGRFAAMTGAKNFVSTNRGLAFRLPSRMWASSGINIVHVELDGSDRYNIRFIRSRSTTPPKLVVEETGVYAENLRRIFELNTGLATSL